MTGRETRSAVPFVVLVLVLAGMGYLGWRVYDLPVDEHSAGRVAVRATDTVVRAGGGDTKVCSAMRDVAAPDDAEASVQRCGEIASLAGSGGAGWLGTRDLQATEIDVGRHSGTVTVSGTLLTRGPALPLSFTWPVERDDGAWVISGAPDVEID
jgi:hypothetical protein